MTRARLACCALSILLSLAGCAEDPRAAFQRCDSAHFSYSFRSELDVSCDAQLALLEAHRSHFAEVVGGVPPLHVHYFLYRDHDDLQAAGPCPKIAEACAPGEEVHSTRPFDEHELVHAFMPGRARPKLWVEGLAEALSCRTGARSCADADWRAVEAEGDSQDQTAPYACGSRLVYRVVAELGMSRASDLNDTLVVKEPAPELDVGLAGYGVGLDELWSTSVVDGNGGYCLSLSACAGAELADGASVLTPYAAGAATSRLPRHSGKLVHLHSRGERVGFSLQSCQPTLIPGRNDAWSVSEPTPADIWLETDGGDYALAPLTDELDVAVLSQGFSETCEDSPTLSVTLGQPLLLRVPLDGRRLVFPFEVSGGSRVDLELEGNDTNLEHALLCDSCESDDASCTLLDWSLGPISLPVHPGVLVMQSASAETTGAMTVSWRVRR